MRSNNIWNALVKTAAVAGVLLASGATYAEDIYLQAQSFDKTLTLPDASEVVVPMWGFASCSDADFDDCQLPDATNAPGPQINIDLTVNTALTIHVKNTLTTPVSVVIPGQVEADAGGPVPFTDAKGRTRVRSFTHEAAAGGGTATYTWSNLRPGTYLYQSGTYPSIQVPMGLYGALVVNVAANEAYAGVTYDTDTVMLFSEIDPLQNMQVDAAAGVADYPSTVDYSPTYLLVNGELSANLSALGNGTDASDGLLRFLNAGLRSHTPSIVGLDMGLIAEDGNPYPGLARQQSKALLPAGKTLDAMIAVPASNVTLALFDRMPSFNNADLQESGFVAGLQVGTGTPPPPDATIYAVDDVYAVTEDTLNYPGATVLSNDVGLVPADTTVEAASPPPNAQSFVMNSNGTFDYTPNENFSGSDSFSYVATQGGATYSAQVVLNVSFENDAPVATADGPYVNAFDSTIVVDAAHGVLGNDMDPDGDTLTAVLDTGGSSVTLAADGSFTYTGAVGLASFTYHVEDPDGLSSAPVAVSLNINPQANISLTVQEPGGAAVNSYRWLVQEDLTYRIDPAHTDPDDPLATPLIEQQFLNFHKSSMPVVAQGCMDCDPVVSIGDLALDPEKHYYVSVLPNDAATGEGHTIGGAQIAPGQQNVTVVVNKQEIPLAQISVYTFDDSAPTNGVPDAGEAALGGSQIILEDAGGRYGMSGGTMSQDFEGVPLTNSLDCFGSGGQPTGVILTCPDTPANQAAGLVGQALIKRLPPGKYGVIAVPPTDGNKWVQTSTIEGTKVIDAWVKAGEPPFMLEFGGPGPHAFFGFVNPETTCLGAAPCPVDPGTPRPTGYDISGKVTLLHDPRPPGIPGTSNSDSYDGLAHTRAWVGLNTIAGDGPNIATVEADLDGSFTITGIPNGTYQLVIWDVYLNQVISFQTVTVASSNVAVGNVGVPAWFARAEHSVFLDDGAGGGTAANGIQDGDEAPLAEQAVNLRWRDGTVNQSFPTDTDGFVPFDQIFPFFSWQVFEVDYTRFKPTGVTVVVDNGGAVDESNVLFPQEGSPRTEAGPVLTQAFQGFPGQTSTIAWGKKPYEAGENGGISGIVFYGSTRGENDPRLTVGDPWEPGIAGATVRLYREIQRNPDEVDTNVDPQNDFPGPGDVDVNGNGVFEGPTALVLIEEVQTDSWDDPDSIPTGCPGEIADDPFTTETLGVENIDRCYDGWRNWNQVRPGTFDGGYAFGASEEDRLPPGTYVVEVVPPTGYELIKEQDVNVGFGDAYGSVIGPAPVSVTLPNGMLTLVIPDQAMIEAGKGIEPGIAQPPCVGAYQVVPDELSLFPGEPTGFAGATRPLCDRKKVILSDQGQAAADFHLFTSTPVATQFTGLITDDISNEIDRRSPGFGEKWSPAFLPFSIRDFNGLEVYRGYGDAFGRYNGLAPSTFTANIPIPSGYSPAMLAACLNDPGDGPDIDPLRLGNYSNSCYTMQFMPGTTTYLDTPILPTAAFAAGFYPADCAAPDRTPTIASVAGDSSVGPLVTAGGQLTITSNGLTEIPNPNYGGPLGTTNATIFRDLGFGANGTVMLAGDTDVPLTGVNWTDTSISGTVPAGTPSGSYQLIVTRNTGETSINSVTVTVGGGAIEVSDGGSIQAAIDAANAGDLIIVGPGNYDEMVVMSKPVRLQGSGTDTLINAVKRPTEKLQSWLTLVEGLFTSGAVDPLPGQADFALSTEQGAGITVLAKNDGSWSTANAPRIDGFTITGADVGGGIFVNGYADNLEISNNNITGNSGFRHGGIRVGHPALAAEGNGPFAFNANINIHHNAITSNGALNFDSAGGGVSLNRGTDDYVVSDNFICGNYTAGDGAGVGHLGLSENGLIQSNKIVFNQSLNLSFSQHGGGIVVAGEPGEPPALSLGAGDVTIDANLIQGNQAASGHGGGIRSQLFNGQDRQSNNANNWHLLTITNNMIVNNVAGWSGGGISLQDSVNANIVLNTIANNDSTATAGAVLGAGGVSTPQPAGISSELNSLGLNAIIPGNSANKAFSNPTLTHNILWHNRAFYFNGAEVQPKLDPTYAGECVSGANYADLGVLDLGPGLNPRRNLMTDTTGYHSSNVAGDPLLVDEYCNGGRNLGDAGPILATAAFAEGGNAVDVRYGPLTLAWPTTDAAWDYHIKDLSPAIDISNDGNQPSGDTVNSDYDGDTRPQGPRSDAGADEFVAGTAPQIIASVIPTALTFGNVLPGEVATLDLTLSNAGPGGPIADIALGAFPAGFSRQGGSCGISLAMDSSCTITVQFAPTGEQDYVGSLEITASNATFSNSPVPLSGVGFEAPIASVAPSPLAFGDVLWDAATASLDLTLSNTGTVSLEGIAVGALPVGSGFSQTGSTCGATLPAGGDCTITVEFAPTAEAPYGVDLEITSTNATVTGSPVAISGVGISAAAATVSTATLEFGDLAIGNTATQDLFLSNTGNLNLENVVIGGFPAGFSQASSDCTATLIVGASCTITVQFSPTELLDYSGELSITAANAEVTNAPVLLNGVGIAAQGAVAFTNATGAATLNGDTLDFGNQPGTGRALSDVTLTVSGDPVTFGTLTVTGSNDFDKRRDQCSGRTIAAGSSCTVRIRFRRNGNNDEEGLLTVPHDGTGAPQQLALIGQ